MLRRLLPLVLLTGLLVGAPSALASSQQGVNLPGNFFTDEGSYAAVQRSGASWVRVFVYVDQASDGVLAEYRRAADRYRAMGVSTEAVLLERPDSPLRGDPSGFARQAARAAGALGPGLQAVEIWNEEDAQAFWAGGPDPAAYAALLRASHDSVKRVRPDVSVLIGGLTGNDAAFLGRLLDQDVGGSFDAVGVHTDTACNLLSPYDFQKDNAGVLTFSSFLGFREVLRVLDAHGQRAKKIWFTELGWSTSGRTCDQGVWAGQKAGGVSEAQQATYLRQAFHCIAGEPRIGPALWFNLRDGTAGDTVDGRYGLLRHDGAEKDAFGVFTDVAHNGDRLTGPCGSFDGPAVALTQLGDPSGSNRLTARYAKQLRVAGTASDADVVGRVTLFLDGAKVRSFTSQKATTMPFAIAIDRAKRLRAGVHHLTVEAKDMKGNVTSRSFDVTKGAAARARTKHSAR